MTKSIISPLIPLIRSQYKLDWRGIHGVAHWSRVRAIGLMLAKRTGADEAVVELFAFLHDSCRHDDHQDIDHGDRAADFILRIRDQLPISDHQVKLLTTACIGHSLGGVEGDKTVLACWDADRLDLWRLGIRPEPVYLCTEVAKLDGTIEWARTLVSTPSAGCAEHLRALRCSSLRQSFASQNCGAPSVSVAEKRRPW